MSESLDFREFHQLLLKAARVAFTTIQKQHADETFYGFGLYHEPLWGYIVPTSNTEEGLIQVANKYKLDEYGLGYAQWAIE